MGLSEVRARQEDLLIEGGDLTRHLFLGLAERVGLFTLGCRVPHRDPPVYLGKKQQEICEKHEKVSGFVR